MKLPLSPLSISSSADSQLRKEAVGDQVRIDPTSCTQDIESAGQRSEYIPWRRHGLILNLAVPRGPPVTGRPPSPEDNTVTTGRGALHALSNALTSALEWEMRMHDVFLRRFGNPNILTYIHCIPVLPRQLEVFSETAELPGSFPWKLTSLMLNTLINLSLTSERPRPRMDDFPRPLPEDYAMRGFPWADRYFPSDWFSNEKYLDDELVLGGAVLGRSVTTSDHAPHLNTVGHSAGRAYSSLLAIFRHSSINLRQILRFSAILSMVAHTFAQPDDPWRIAKVFSVGTTAAGSLGASALSLQLDMGDPPQGNVGLRVACSVLTSALAVLYSLFFLKNKDTSKARRFVEGICVGGALCFLFVRLVGSSSSSNNQTDTDDHNRTIFLLDEFNLSVLIAVGFGILNAERSLFTCDSSDAKNEGLELVSVNGAQDNNSNLRHGDADIERGDNSRRRHEQEGHQEGGLHDINIVELGVGAVVQNPFSAFSV